MAGDLVVSVSLMARMSPAALVVLVMVVSGAMAVFNPTLSVDSCTKSTLVLTLVDASDTGIVYVQGQGAACKQPTASGSQQHTIDFTSCGITWESTFKIVVQKKAAYQTGDDQQIPIMCIADLSDLTVSNNLNAADKDDDAGQNKTVKPTASMVLYKDGGDIGGGTVKLTDTITMIIKLDDEYIDDFDIKATECSASTIPITQSYCATDIELFPQFTRVQQGEVSATFGAFRTTDLNGGAVAMPFSCTIQVCLGSCPSTTCADSAAGYGRKRRSIHKRQAEGSGMDDINVGSSISISTEEVVIESPEDDGDMCMNQGAFVAIVIVLVGGAVASSIASVIMFKKLQEKASILNKLNGAGNIPIA